MNSIEIWVDPLCPWACVTSRWLTEVERLGEAEVQFRAELADTGAQVDEELIHEPFVGVAFFGPVVTRGFYELKRSHDRDPEFN